MDQRLYCSKVNNNNDILLYCQELVKKYDFENFLCTLLLPLSARNAVFALRAFNVELALIRDKIEYGSGVADIRRLEFWQDALDTIYGQSKGPVPRQPVALALKTFAPSASHHLLSNLVKTRQQTLGDRPFVSVSSLEDYGLHTHGSMLTLTLETLENDLNESTLQAAASIGIALGIVTHLRSVLPLVQRGIVVLPQDLMKQYDINPTNLLRGKPPPRFADLIYDLGNRVTTHLSHARQLKSQVPSNFRPGLLSASMVDLFLSRLKKANCNVMDPNLQLRYPFLVVYLYWKYLIRSF